MSTPLPVAPSTLRPDTFAPEMDAFLAAMVTYQTEMDAAGSVAGLSLQGNSTTSLLIGTGSKSLTIETGKGFSPGNSVTVASTASPANVMVGSVTSYNGATGALVVSVASVTGSGTFAVWSVAIGVGVNPANIATLAGAQSLSNKTLIAPVLDGVPVEDVFTITDGASVDINPANGGIQLWTLGASRTPTATSFAAGQAITLLIDDGTAFSITWSTIGVVWLNTTGTAPTLKTAGYTPIVLWKVGSTVYGAG